jgi:transcriptional regulator with XRE-family HTH domain
MGIGFASEAAHIQELGHLSVGDIARGTGADDSTVRAWLNDSRSPSGDRAERLAELSSIVERLVLIVKSEYVPVWLRKPNVLLADDKPLDLIAVGEYRKVSKVLASLESSPIS